MVVPTRSFTELGRYHWRRIPVQACVRVRSEQQFSLLSGCGGPQSLMPFDELLSTGQCSMVSLPILWGFMSAESLPNVLRVAADARLPGTVHREAP